jgi:hypothetical protein
MRSMGCHQDEESLIGHRLLGIIPRKTTPGSIVDIIDYEKN